MSDEPDGTNSDNGTPPPQNIPPAAAAPPPLAESPPPAAAPPPQAPPPAAPAQPVAPKKKFLSPELIVAIGFALILAVAGILWATGVFDRGSNRPDGPLPTVAPVPMPPPSASETYPGADELASPPCDNVRNARDVAGVPPGEGEQRNLLAITAGGTYEWNGAEVDAVRLRQYLDLVGSMSPTPVTVVRVDPGAPPAAISTVSDAIDRALRCRFQPS